MTLINFRYTIITACFLFLSTVAMAQNKINYVGSSTVGVFIHNAEKELSSFEFSINTKPESSGGESFVARGKSNLGGVAREVKERFLKMGVQKHLIGKDAIGVWVNKNNPLKSLSPAQLKQIFTGKAKNWSDVGGPDHEIEIYLVSPKSATRKVFRKVILGEQRYKGRHFNTIQDDPKVLDKVANDPYGIGLLSFAIATGHPAEKSVKKLNIGKQKASVHNPNYPITRPLYLTTKGAPKGGVDKFIKWVKSSKGQKIVKKTFVGI